MDRGEFLALLRESLEGYIPRADVEENIAFYRNYFDETDRSDKEIIEELGDPRLIARTIIEAYKASKGPMADYYTEQARSEYSQAHSSAGESGSFHEYTEEKGAWKRSAVHWGILFCVLIVLLALVVLVGKIIIFFLPILLVILAVKLIVDYFEK